MNYRIRDEQDCRICLEPQYCECNCGTCQDARIIYMEELEHAESSVSDTIAHDMYLENLNDIEKDGQ